MAATFHRSGLQLVSHHRRHDQITPYAELGGSGGTERTVQKGDGEFPRAERSSGEPCDSCSLWALSLVCRVFRLQLRGGLPATYTFRQLKWRWGIAKASIPPPPLQSPKPPRQQHQPSALDPINHTPPHSTLKPTLKPTLKFAIAKFHHPPGSPQSLLSENVHQTPPPAALPPHPRAPKLP